MSPQIRIPCCTSTLKSIGIRQNTRRNFLHTFSGRQERLLLHETDNTGPAHFVQVRRGKRPTVSFDAHLSISSGETGSGKSENRRLAIKSLLKPSVSKPGTKGSKLATQLPAAEFVLETFGNARTLFNPNASRFGKYTELQFTDCRRLSGVKTLDYYLERNRVAAVPSGERNFHIFYYLVAGASPEERQHLHLLDKSTYQYLGQRGTGVTRPGHDEDAQRFDHR